MGGGVGGRVSVRGEKGWSLATVYVWSTARSRTGGGARARVQEWEGGVVARHRLCTAVWSTARGRRARAGARVGGRGGLGGTLWARRWVVVGSPPSMEHAGRSSAHRGEGRRGGRTRSRSSTTRPAARRVTRASAHREGRRGGRTKSRSSTTHTAARHHRAHDPPPLGTGHVLLVGVDGLDGRKLRTLGVV